MIDSEPACLRARARPSWAPHADEADSPEPSARTRVRRRPATAKPYPGGGQRRYKPANAVVQTDRLPFPTHTQELHHEIELVVALGEGGRDIPVERALDHVFGYAVGLDMTRRDMQAVAKKAGRPWDMAKGFDQSAPPARSGLWRRSATQPRELSGFA